MSGGLARLEQAERMLAEIQTSNDAVGVIELATAAQEYARRARLGERMVIRATDIKVRALFVLASRIDDEGDRRGKEKGKPSLFTQRDLDIRKLARRVVELMDEQRWRKEYDKAIKDEKAPYLHRVLRVLRDERAAADREAALANAAPATRDDIDLRHGDFRDVLADVTDAAAIITDPPYGRDHLHLLGDLAAWVDKALAPDGVLAVLFGQTHLDEAFRRLDGKRPYRWTMCYLTPGNAYVSHPRRVGSNWKPVLLYGAGPRVNDVIQTDADDKRHHEWQQDLHGFSELVRRLSAPGDLVADPFLGGGTTAAACAYSGRRFIGADVSSDAITTTRKRLT